LHRAYGVASAPAERQAAGEPGLAELVDQVVAARPTAGLAYHGWIYEEQRSLGRPVLPCRQRASGGRLPWSRELQFGDEHVQRLTRPRSDICGGPERVPQFIYYSLALGPLHQLTPPLTSASK